MSVLALVFYPEALMERFGSGRMFRDMLAGVGTETTDKRRLREKVLVVSTFEWDAEGREVSVKMKEGWIEEQKWEDGWVVALWRTDEWCACSAAVSLRGGNLRKRAVVWIDPTTGMSESEEEEE